MWRVSERANEVYKRLLEHRAGVLSYSVRSMEKKFIGDDTEDTDLSSPMMSPNSSVTSSTYSRSRFDRAHLFAGHADAQIPKQRRILSAAEILALEQKLKSVTDALNDANKKQAEMSRELSHLRLEKQEVETMMDMELQSAEETIRALRKGLSGLESQEVQLTELLQERTVWEKDRIALAEQTQQVEALKQQLEARAEDTALIEELKASSHLGLERKDNEIRELRVQWAADREAWQKERAEMEDNKLEDLGKLQDEADALRREDNATLQKAHAEIDEAVDTLRAMAQQHGMVLYSREHSLQGLLSSVGTHLQSVVARSDACDKAKEDWEVLRRKLEEDVRSGLDKRETLVREVEEARREREDARTEIRLLETRLKVFPSNCH
jgi:DNA repair exonuclease SbcCD ATPase subunit